MEDSPALAGINRPYSPQDVERLRGSIHVEHTLARVGAERKVLMLVCEGRHGEIRIK
jgi:isocitrate lyase